MTNIYFDYHIYIYRTLIFNLYNYLAFKCIPQIRIQTTEIQCNRELRQRQLLPKAIWPLVQAKTSLLRPRINLENTSI